MQVQIDAAIKACQRPAKKGKSQVGEFTKAFGKSLAKLVVQVDPPTSSTPIGQGLEPVAWLVFVLTLNVVDLKIDLVGGLSSYLKKIEGS